MQFQSGFQGGFGDQDVASAGQRTKSKAGLEGAQLGRDFRPEEDVAGGANVVLLSDDYWRQRFNRDPGIVGQTLNFDNRAYTVIGILPASFRFPFGGTPVWTTRPFEQEGIPRDLIQRGSGYLLVNARLKPGVTLPQVNEQLKVINARYAAAFPDKVDANAGKDYPNQINRMKQLIAQRAKSLESQLKAKFGDQWIQFDAPAEIYGGKPAEFVIFRIFQKTQEAKS